ncbi:hypothetical protein BD770DRAFT_439200 [Pilaira anomala]|nr:hypothetical protein BD770DRAFT_439200 [Pilaira anomala]
MALHDNTDAFPVEAGLSYPSESSMLGVDMEGIRNQHCLISHQSSSVHITNSNSSSSPSAPSSSSIGSSSSKRKFEGELSDNNKRLKSESLGDLPITDSEVQSTSDIEQKENVHPDNLHTDNLHATNIHVGNIQTDTETKVYENHLDNTSTATHNLTGDTRRTETEDELDDNVFYDASDILHPTAEAYYNSSIDIQIARIKGKEMQAGNDIYTGSNAAESSEHPIFDQFDEIIFSDAEDMAFDYDTDHLGTAPDHSSAYFQTTLGSATATEPETTEFEITEPVTTESSIATDEVNQTAAGSASVSSSTDFNTTHIETNQPSNENNPTPHNLLVIEIIDDDDDDSIINVSGPSVHSNSDITNQSTNRALVVDLTEDDSEGDMYAARDGFDSTDDNDKPFDPPHIPVDLTAGFSSPTFSPVGSTIEESVPAPVLGYAVHPAPSQSELSPSPSPLQSPRHSIFYHVIDDLDDDVQMYNRLRPTGFEDNIPNVHVSLPDNTGRYQLHGEGESSERPNVRHRHFAGNATTQPNSGNYIEQNTLNLVQNTVDVSLLSPEERIDTPDGLSITLMEHQKTDLQWMQKMEDSPNHRGGVLADEAGLGKAIQAISIIITNPCTDYTPVNHSATQVHQPLRPNELKVKVALIICLASLLDQWKREIETKTSPQLKALVYHGPSRSSSRKNNTNHRVTLTHVPVLYEHVWSHHEEQAAEIRRFTSSVKIHKVTEILKQTATETNDEDKTVVFSQFTGLFGPDPNIKVLLASTKCGSTGLNLTCANRVILLDLWWDPTLENQAIDSVHRIGQLKEVEIYRIFINDTVEQRIFCLQSKKQARMKGIFGQTDVKLRLKDLVYLFRGGNL